MSKYLSIIFLSIYLFTVVQVNELCKIPNLIEHYYEHQQDESDISLLEFVCIHYMHGEVYDDDFSKDMKLPFKSQSFTAMFSMEFFQTIQDYSFAPKFYFEEYKPQDFKYTFVFSSNYFSSIWQPPQLS